MAKNEFKNYKLKKLIFIVLALLGGGLAGAGIDVAVRPTQDGEIKIEATFSMELSDEQVPAEIETEQGTIEVIDAPTVVEVSGNQLVDECPEGEEECGRGRYIYAPTETFTEFKDYTLGGCWDVDNYPQGAKVQCWDLAALFWMNYTNDGRVLSTCGTGAAKGAWNCKEQNAGNEFELIYEPTELQAGDWIIFGSGRYGHVGMALGGYNNGYIALLGQNQGGAACLEGGSAANIINISLKSFLGAFRPKTYIKPQPQPEPIPVSNCVEWGVKKGDTMSGIMLKCENTVVYGEAMDNYAKTWFSRYYKPGQSVYEGWKSPTGIGLYAGDTIDHKTK